MPRDAFNVYRRSDDGLQPKCRECHKAAYRADKSYRVALSQQWAEANPEKKRGHRRGLYHRKSLEWRMINNRRFDAANKGIPFTITPEDITIPDKCPVLGIPIFVNAGKNSNTDNSPSLDRIVPELGYVRGNIGVISMRANRIKNDSEPWELLAICEYSMGAISPEMKGAFDALGRMMEAETAKRAAGNGL